VLGLLFWTTPLIMPGIARKIVICAAIDGLIVQPLSSKGQRPFQPVRVRYGDSSISAVPRDQLPDTSTPESSFEAFGVIGQAQGHLRGSLGD
jgi:hypothetical protein